MRFLLSALIFATSLAVSTGAGAQVPADPDILCDNAPPGTVEEIPPPLDRWIIVLCAPDGQALMPRLRDEVEMWLERDTARPFKIAAAPAGVLQGTGSFTKYDLRFSNFSGRLATAGQRTLLLELWQQAFGQAGLPAGMGDVYQLDAVSVYGGEPIHLFVYLRGDAPRWMVYCRDRCRIGVPLDVLRGAELAARVQEHEQQGR